MLGQFRFEYRPLLLYEKSTGSFEKKRKETEEKLCYAERVQTFRMFQTLQLCSQNRKIRLIIKCPMRVFILLIVV